MSLSASLASSSSPSPATANAEFLLSLSAPPDRGGPRTAPSEAELLIDPQFYSFLSGLTVVVLLVAFSYVIAYATLSAVRRRQYRKYRQRRRHEEARDALVRRATPSQQRTAALPPRPSLVAPRPSPPPPAAFVRAVRPFAAFALPPLYASTPSFLSGGRKLPALLRPLTAALAAASAASPSQLPRLSLSFTSPAAALSEYVLSIITPRSSGSSRRRPSMPFTSPQFTPAPTTNGSAHPSPPVSTRSRFASSSVLPRTESTREPAKAADVSGVDPSSRPSAALSAFQQDELDAQQREHNRGFLSFSLSTFLLTIALLWLSLVTLTLTLSTPSLTSHWLLTWLTADLVSSLWTIVPLLTSLSLFLVAPFAYLYYEAEGLVLFPLPLFVTSRRLGAEEDETASFVPRCVETVVVLSFFSVMLYGSFHVLHAIVWQLPLLGWRWRWSVLESLWRVTQSFSLSALFSPAALSNVVHFVPGMLISLTHSHSGFSSLLAAAFSLRIPFYYRHHLTQQMDTAEVKLVHARRMLQSASSPSRRAVLARRIQALEQRATAVDAELRPPLLSLSAFPVVRNAVWFGLSLLCLLLVWHVMVRVMQREARLMMTSVDQLIAQDEDGSARGGLLPLILTALVSALKFLLRSIKHAVNGLLFAMGMIRRRDMERMAEAGVASTAAALPTVRPLSASLLLHVWSDVLRLVSSFLLGQNGFKAPLSSLLFDLLVANFFCIACTIGLYRMPLMAPYSPFSSFASTASAAFAQAEIHQPPAEVTDHRSDGTAEASRSAAARASTSASAAPLSEPSALHSAQFFVVNTTVLLLLTASFPFSLWLLGLCSFDLPRFYPSAAELSSGLFIHVYNLAFIVLSARQGAALWSRTLWFLVKTSYASTFIMLTWILPSLAQSLPSPDALAALPSRVRAHPWWERLSFLLSWPGLYWALKAMCTPLLRLLWVLLLHALRVLALGLRLCARNLYLRAVQSISQQLRAHPVPLVNRQRQDAPVPQDGGVHDGDARRALSRLRGMDENRSPALILQGKEESSAALLLLPREEGKEHRRESSQPPSSLTPVLRPSPSPPRAFTHTSALTNGSPAVRLVAPRPLSLATSLSLDALSADIEPSRTRSSPGTSMPLSRSASQDMTAAPVFASPTSSPSSSSATSPLRSTGFFPLSPLPPASLLHSSLSVDNTASHPPRRPHRRGKGG